MHTKYFFQNTIVENKLKIIVAVFPLVDNCTYTFTIISGYYVTSGPNKGKSGNFYYIYSVDTSKNSIIECLLDNIASDVPSIDFWLENTLDGVSCCAVGSKLDITSFSGTIDVLKHK